MKKTESVVNLTQPSLYGIYNSSSSNLNMENEEVEEYLDGAGLRIRANESHPNTPRAVSRGTAPRVSTPVKVATRAAKAAVVIVAALAYNQVTKNIHTVHVDGNGAVINAYLTKFMASFKPTAVLAPARSPSSSALAIADLLLTLFFEGLALSSIVPVLDRALPAYCTQRVLSSNPDPQHRANLKSDIVRSSIAFLGISYAVRNIQWKSSLQMALTWTLLNPGLWMLLDGTLNGFVGSISAAMLGSGAIYVQSGSAFSGDSESLFTIFLFIASFFFCGVIIFGKLGRFLFGEQ